jgi:acetylornithine deacetylase
MLDKEFRSFILDIVEKNKEVFSHMPEITARSRYLWPFEMDRNHHGIRYLVELSKNFGWKTPVVAGAKFACDGFIFTKYYNTPAIIFGPRGGNAHAQDEFVIAEDLILLTKIYLGFIFKWCC